MTILSWPIELIECVLIHLHPIYIVQCRQICTLLREIVDSSTELRLRIELAEDGHVLNERGNEPASTLRERVLSHRRALDTLNPKLVFRATIADFTPYRYDISDGITGRLMESESNTGVYRIVYHELGCATDENRWKLTWETDMKISDLSFWAGDDIQVLTEDYDPGYCKRLHFRTMSTNSPHPLAANPYLDFREPDVPVSEPSFTCMYDDTVMMIFKPASSERDGRVFALNWKTGELLLPYRNASDAAFISKDRVLLAVKMTESSQQAGFELISLGSEETIWFFLLPFVGPINQIAIINNQNYRFPRNSFSSSSREFMPDPDLNILGVQINWDDGITGAATMVLSVKSLRDICDSNAMISSKREFKWNAWGPSSTRWLPSTIEDAGDLCVFGSRIAVWESRYNEEEGEFDPKQLAILDFNPRGLRRSKLNGGNHDVVDTETISEFLHGYDRRVPLSVVSSLPFRKLVAGPSPYYNIDIDGMYLVCREDLDDMSILQLCAEH